MSDGRGNVVEFVVETESLPGCVRTSGSVGSLGAFNGRVVSVEKL
jgi:hypothetical protein